MTAWRIISSNEACFGVLVLKAGLALHLTDLLVKGSIGLVRIHWKLVVHRGSSRCVGCANAHQLEHPKPRWHGHGAVYGPMHTNLDEKSTLPPKAELWLGSGSDSTCTMPGL